MKNWIVQFTSKSGKKYLKLPDKIKIIVDTLIKEIEESGPIRKNWPSFGPLSKSKGIPINSFHCHLKDGRPTYVACWAIENKEIKLVEIYYVGTHEGAPY